MRPRAAPRRSRRTCSAPPATASCRRRIRRCAGPPSPATAPAMRPTTRGCATRTGRRRRGSARSPLTAFPPPAARPSSGYDSLNRTRKKAKFYPGQAKPKPPPGPGSKPPGMRDPNARVRLSVPPSETANKTPIPPAMAGTVPGQPPRKRLKIDDDPFGAVGDYAGSFLIKSALELRGGYDTNPRRTVVPAGSPFYVIAPELVVFSDWERHALVADLRGSFTGYGNTFPPPTDGTISSAPVDHRPAGLHRPHRRPSRRQPRHPPHRADAAARRHRQSRQPEHPGRPRAIPGLFDARRHPRRRPEFQPPAAFRRRTRSTAPSIRTRN